MKILELFSGYGTASFALKRLVKRGIIDKYECVGYSDIDKYANQCFRQNHWTTLSNGNGNIIASYPAELGDVTKVDPEQLEDFDLLTGGFPCQAFSVAGKGLGELDTRGTLFNEIIRIAEVKKPRYMLLENVKGLISKKHQPTFQKILSELDRIGYHVHWKVLNTKDYGIPQNRERVWFVCFKKEIPTTFARVNGYKTKFERFNFPEKEELKLRLKDILEDSVGEKYYLSEKAVARLTNNGQGFHSKINPEIASCLFSSQHKIARGMDIIQLNKPKHSNDRVYSDKGISPTLNTMQGGDRQPFILQRPRGTNSGGEKAKDGVSPTICGSYWHQNNLLTEGVIVRKLTPKECFRLQGFLNDEVNLEGLSNTQQYKLAGNGQSVNVVTKIFEKMFA